jgi:hypothetical protein
MKIGILYICTGKYDIFWKDFYLSCEKYFIPEAEKQYFVFTDSPEIEFEKVNKNIHKIFQQNLGWPNNTLKRYKMFSSVSNELKNIDYIFFLNADFLFVENITAEEFLPIDNEELVACIHPGYFDKKKSKFPYEKNKESLAFIQKNEGKFYFAGGINGGKTTKFIKAIDQLKSNIDIDLKNNIIAIWHDESHWNKYLVDKLEKVKILHPGFLYPESFDIPFDKKIVIRDKRKYFDYSHIGKSTNSKIIKKLKENLKKIYFIRSSRTWVTLGKWLRRFKFLTTIYKNNKKNAFYAFLKNDKELKLIRNEINSYCVSGVCNFNNIKIPRSAVSIDNFFNVLLPHAQKINYTKQNIEKYYSDLKNKYKSLIYWKDNIGTVEPDYQGAHLISHGFTYFMNEINVNKGDTVLDIGAAPGDFSTLCIAKNAYKVYAFEPEKIQIDILRKINKLNNGKIEIVQKYCDEVLGDDTTTIDKFIEENKIKQVNFIKMDIEGAEPKALRGAKNTLKVYRPKLAICTYHNKKDEEDIKNVILEANPDYNFYVEKGIIYAY